MLVLYRILHSSIDPTSARMGRWTTDEDTKLEDAVLPRSCQVERDYSVLKDGIVSTPGHTGLWTTEEDIKLRDAARRLELFCVALVPGRTRK
jgi:hypothetical protein